MFNQAHLIGNLGRDPEIRFTKDGKKIANFTMATSERWKDKDNGEKKERTEWHRVVVFGDGLAGVVEKYAKKGSKVHVVGAIRTRSWTGDDGIEKYTTEIQLSGPSCVLTLLDKLDSNRPPEPPPHTGEEGG